MLGCKLQWDFQNKGKSAWTGMSSFVLEISLCNLHPSIINSVPCERIMQRAYWFGKVGSILKQLIKVYIIHSVNSSINIIWTTLIPKTVEAIFSVIQEIIISYQYWVFNSI